MNQQEAFNQVVSNMRDQGKPCYVNAFGCAFENKANKTRCAIGSMLSSETLQIWRIYTMAHPLICTGCRSVKLNGELMLQRLV